MPASIVFDANPFYRRLSEGAGILASAALMLLLANMHPVWRPWTVGVITEGWPSAAEAITVACFVALAGPLATAAIVFATRIGRLIVQLAPEE